MGALKRSPGCGCCGTSGPCPTGILPAGPLTLTTTAGGGKSWTLAWNGLTGSSALWTICTSNGGSKYSLTVGCGATNTTPPLVGLIVFNSSVACTGSVNCSVSGGSGLTLVSYTPSPLMVTWTVNSDSGVAGTPTFCMNSVAMCTRALGGDTITLSG